MFADDLAILADSHTGLQQSLNSLDVYCSRLRIKVNAKIYSSRSNTNQEQCFSINNVRVETVKQHEYLGITLQNNGSFKHSIATLPWLTKQERHIFR